MGNYKRTKRPPFSEVIDAFINNLDVLTKSKETYRMWLRPFHKFIVINDIDVWKVDRPIILEYKASLAGQRSDKTVNCYLTALKKFYTWADAAGYLDGNTAAGIAGLRLRKMYRKQPLTVDQVSHLLDSIDKDSPLGKRVFLIVQLMISAGLRSCEVSRLERNHLKGNMLFVHGKGRASADAPVPIHPELANQLRTNAGEKYLFETIQGNQLSSSRIGTVVRNQLKHAGLKSDTVSTHSLRHTFATLTMKRTGNNVWIVKKALRHSDLKISQIYIENMLDDDPSIVENLNSGIFDEINHREPQKTPQATTSR